MTIHRVTIVDGIGIQETEITAYDLEEYARMLFDKTCQEVHNRTNISKTDRGLFEDCATTFACMLEEIININDTQTRETALKLAIAALSIGYYHAGGPNILQGMKERFNKEHPKKANDARRQPKIQDIVERHARALWKRKPWLKKTHEGTAKGIWEAAHVEINTLPKVPEAWVIKNPNDQDEIRRAIQRTAKRIARMQ